MKNNLSELALFFGGLFLCGLLASTMVVYFSPQNDGENTSTIGYILNAFLTQFILFGGTVLLFFKTLSIPFNTYISIGYPKRKDWLYTIGSFLLAIALTISFSPIANWIEISFSDHPWVMHQIKINSIQNNVIGSLREGKLPIAILTFAILPAILEELVFRGILYKIIKNITAKKHLSMVISALIFSLFHFQVLSFIPIMLVGILLAFLYEKTNNLLNAMLLHFTFNAIQIVFWQA